MDHAINWVWQGCLIAAMTMVVLRVMERTRAQARYAVCWIAMAAITLLPVLPSGFALPASAAVPPSDVAGAAPVLAVPDVWWTSTTVVALAGAAWFLLAVCRLTGSVRAARRARAACTPFGSDLESQLRCWNDVKAQGRQTRLMLSPAMRAASVLGGGRPIIAVAPALIDRLGPDELDRIVIHEWAHVQRRDDLLSLAHAIIRTVAGWHPAVWWLERRMLIEREIACDETAVRLTGCPKRYAACLTAIATLPAVSLEPMEAVGVLSTPALSRRIVRILSQRRLASPASSAAAAVIAVLVLSAFSVTAAGHRVARAIGSGPILEASFLPGAGSQGGPGAVAAVPQRGSALARRLASDASDGQQSSQGSTPPSRAVQENGARETTTADAPRRGAAEMSAPHPPNAAASPVTAPALMPLTASAPSLPIIDKRAMAPPLLTPQTPDTSPWTAVADAGVSVGHGSKQAGVATGQFFGQLGKKIAGSF
jgi:D-alanyl-D-alanine endopeptidase (penicillin-binding protein 7)